MRETEEEIKKRVERVWKALAKYGIYTEEQLDEALKNTEPINIGCMVAQPFSKEDIEKGKKGKN